ncbi:acyltransferase [Yoonia sp.]|uniref:acyltransferase family protein n=1 Tax=Yoonia sp. TaxID=2212373 RepID=UPI00232EF5E7|nr:acyltransferase family protein [Yoonia sp.]MDB4240873.1 acyltransferase [Yoonia sp.]MDB4254748.1 acyltransferase [bacterium]
MATHLRYRPDIDGLRAIAVLAVILYHADATLVPGGYLGVDLFFVISGYLITALLARDLEATGRVSLGSFYERRARRILPALLVVVIATLPFAAMWMLPSRLAEYWVSILTVMGFSSNLLFWFRTGYFMPAGEQEPLLHTWSLSVEEQFYLFFPLLLWFLWRYGRRARFVALAALFIASLILTNWLVGRAPSANFYLLPSRAWELLAGALLALSPLSLGALSSRIWREIGAATGLVLIFISLFLLDESIAMPSFWALIPVCGAVLVIAVSDGTWTGRLLGSPVPRAIGLISYSAYLWHWPLFVFARLRFGEALTQSVIVPLVLATLGLATLSYFFVERPLRRRGPGSPVNLRTFALVTGAVVILLPLATAVLPLLPRGSLTGLTAVEIEAKVATNYGLSEVCEGAFTLDPVCRTSDTPEVLIWGDSFAMHLVPAIKVGASHGLIQMTKSVCIPAVGISVMTPEYPAAWAEGCIAFNDAVLDWLATQESIDTVVVSSPFGLVFNDVYQRGGAIAAAPRPDLVADALSATAQRIQAMGKAFVIVSPPPVTGEDLGQCLVQAALAQRPTDACDFPVDGIHRLSRLVLDFLDDLSEDVPVVSLVPLICPEAECITRQGDTFIYRDQGHLSIEGSALIGRYHSLFKLVQNAASAVD